MKILIIGCGYVGKAIAKRWKNKGHTITATTRRPERVDELEKICNKVILIKGHIKEALAGQDCVLLSVAPDRQHSVDYERTYLHTAKDLCEGLKENPQIKHLLYTSSISVYGDKGGKWIDESEPLTPANTSTEFLCRAEELLAEQPSCILRLGEIYGPGRDFTNRLNRLPVFPGTGQNFINITHLENIVNALDFALENKLEGAYNLVEDLHITRKELYDQISKKYSLPPPKWDPTLKSLHGSNKRVNCDKIKNAGFQITEHTFY